MFTKKFLFGCVVVAVLLITFSGTPLAYDDDNQSCDPAGLWFGLPEGETQCKVVSVIPLDGGKKRYILVAEDQDPEVTPFRGEMVRIKKNRYKMWGMMHFQLEPEIFAYLVISGEWYMTDCNTGVGNYLASIYDKDPFHDSSANLLFSWSIVNMYDRMPMIDDSSDF